MKRRLLVLGCALILAVGCTEDVPPSTEAVVAEQSVPAAHPGEAPYRAQCAECHDQPVYKAPSRTFLALMGPQNVLDAMNGGLMSAQAEPLGEQARRDIAEYLTGQDLDARGEAAAPPLCGDAAQFDATRPPVAAGYGVDHRNSRFQPADGGGLTAAAVPELEVRWVFAYPGAIKARSQPAYGGGAVYFGSQDGTVRALDAQSGCLRWSFKASAEVRNALVISPWAAEDPDPEPLLYFADILARVYAVRARDGELVWSAKVDEHPDATVTGAVALAGGRLYVPVSSLEVVAALDPAYECCTFRGSVVALDATSGERLWKTHTIDDAPREAGRNPVGTRILAPSGAPVWTSPTLDLGRNRLYVGTGENYSSPADGNSDALMAFDLESGEKLWVNQQTEGDAWNTGCLPLAPEERANCPAENGPDYDFGASPILVPLAGDGDVLVGGQKSGAVMGVDPESGETLWKVQVGRGGIQGGIHFGMAAAGSTVYVPINDMVYPVDSMRYGPDDPPRPGLYALDATDGAIIWSSPVQNRCGDMEGCDPGISQAITAIPGAVIAGHLDGRLRVYSSEDGSVLWELDTLREFQTVSGESARGGSFSGSGPIVAHGTIYVNSGYGIYDHMPGNVLLAIGSAGNQAGN